MEKFAISAQAQADLLAEVKAPREAATSLREQVAYLLEHLNPEDRLMR